jgi:short-subunit dehydrogenase
VLAGSFLQQGAKVILSARDPDRLARAAGELRGTSGVVDSCPADVTQLDQATALIHFVRDRHQRLDVLVNNVGRSDRGLAAETRPERFRELWETNFLSAVHCTQAALPLLVASRGHVVFMGSLASKSSARFLGAYPASKFPLAALAQQLRLELADLGVHVLLVCPGPIAREQAAPRYADLAEGLPAAAFEPGGGVRLKGIEPERLAAAVLRACQRRRRELVVPGKARLLFAIGQLWPALGDWIVRQRSG